MSRIAGVHALITGGSGGVGLAVARRLDAEGCAITLLARGRERCEAAASYIPGALAVAADVSDEAQLAEAWATAKARFGDPAILINNAGYAPSAPLLKTTRIEWDAALAVNLTGAFLCAQLALPWMVECGYGRIVNIASTAGLKGYPYVTAYTAAKHGLVGFTRALALEVAGKGVTVNAVCPGFIDTEMTDRSVERITARTGRTAEQARAELARTNPMGRLVTAEEVADAVAWLCTREAGAVNGVALPVAGGEV